MIIVVLNCDEYGSLFKLFIYFNSFSHTHTHLFSLADIRIVTINIIV